MWLDKEFLPLHQISICISPCYLFASWPFSFSYLNIYIYVYIYVATVALEQQDRRMLLLLLQLSFMRVYMWLRDRDWWWCSEKREKPLFSSFSLSFDRIWLMRYLTTTSYLSLSLLFLLSVRFYLLAECILDELWFDKERGRTRQDNCVHYWNKWSCFTTSEQNDGRERRTRDEWGNHFFLLLLLASYKK